MVSNRTDFSLFTNFAVYFPCFHFFLLTQSVPHSFQVQIRFYSPHDSVTYSQQQVRCLCDSCLFRH